MLKPGDRTAAVIRWRRCILALVAVVAATAVLGGLLRVGVDTGLAWPAHHAMEHGPLLVLGVFGTVIALERAVALGAGWSYAAPGLGAASALLQLSGLPGARRVAVASALALLAVNAAIVGRQSVSFTWLMLLGSALLLLGSAASAMGRPVFAVVPAWLAFFVLTIVAERLELSRLAPTPPWASKALLALAATLAVSCAAMVVLDVVPTGGGAWSRVAGATMAAIGLWQARFDLARRTVRMPGLPGFAGAGVLLGAAWLLVAGLLLVVHGLLPAGPLYDAVVHAVLVGFVLSMVFAHAPIILPAVARVTVPFHPVLYAPLAVLHAGLVLRIAGDLAGGPVARRAGALANAVALLLFLVSVLWARRRPPRHG